MKYHPLTCALLVLGVFLGALSFAEGEETTGGFAVGGLTNCPKEYIPVCGKVLGEYATFLNRCTLDNTGAVFSYDLPCNFSFSQNLDCADSYKPVCGRFDGKEQSFANGCELLRARAEFMYDGECIQVDQTLCDLKYAPVCGIGNQSEGDVTFFNLCLLEEGGSELIHEGPCVQPASLEFEEFRLSSNQRINDVRDALNNSDLPSQFKNSLTTELGNHEKLLNISTNVEQVETIIGRLDEMLAIINGYQSRIDEPVSSDTQYINVASSQTQYRVIYELWIKDLRIALESLSGKSSEHLDRLEDIHASLQGSREDDLDIIRSLLISLEKEAFGETVYDIESARKYDLTWISHTLSTVRALKYKGQEISMLESLEIQIRNTGSLETLRSLEQEMLRIAQSIPWNQLEENNIKITLENYEGYRDFMIQIFEGIFSSIYSQDTDGADQVAEFEDLLSRADTLVKFISLEDPYLDIELRIWPYIIEFLDELRLSKARKSIEFEDLQTWIEHMRNAISSFSEAPEFEQIQRKIDDLQDSSAEVNEESLDSIIDLFIEVDEIVQTFLFNL